MKGALDSLMSILISDGSVWLRLIAVITPTLTRTKPVIIYPPIYSDLAGCEGGEGGGITETSYVRILDSV